MGTNRKTALALVLLLSAGAAPSAPAAHGQLPKGSNVNPDAGLIADFSKRIDAYVNLRKKAERAAPDLERNSRPDKIETAEQTIARRIRALRADATQGDLLTPATAALFRRLLRTPLSKAPGRADNRAIIKDDAPAAAEVPLEVNAEYPKAAPLSTVPPDVLQTLPPLPEDVQYRFVGRHLILYDAKANLVIDYMRDAMP